MKKLIITCLYAHAVAVLAYSGYSKDDGLIESGMKAMDAAAADMASGNAANGHGDFFTWPAMFAFELFQRHASSARRADWERNLRAVAPQELYRVHPGSGNNWGVVNLAGEFLRHRSGFTTFDYAEASLAGQVRNFTELGTYVEYDILGGHKYNPTGLLRIHVKGGNPQLGPSDGCAPMFSCESVNIATGPAWREPGGQWQSLAELSPPRPGVEILEQDPARTRFRVSYARFSVSIG